MAGRPQVRHEPVYLHSEELNRSFAQRVIDIAQECDASAVAELGAGANPIVARPELNFVENRTIFDVSAEELAKANTTPPVQTVVADLCKPLPPSQLRYDVVFSRMLCEHIPDPVAFHRNCFQLLRPGGLAVHYFPTLFALPFVLNRVTPEPLSQWLLGHLQPTRFRDDRHGKFPAYYRWCRGPSDRQVARFHSTGFEVVTWVGGFGHPYYRRLPALDALERRKSDLLIKRRLAHFSAFAIVVLRRVNEPPARPVTEP